MMDPATTRERDVQADMPDMPRDRTDRRLFLAGLAATLIAGRHFFVTEAQAAFGPRVSVAKIDLRQAESYISAVRANHGAGPVRMEGRLVEAARSHSMMMARKGRIAHQFGPGTRFSARIRRAGDFGAAAENVGAGYPSMESVMDGWLRSPGHRRNLLNKKLTHIGFAAAVNPASKYRTYWTLILARP